MPNTTATTSSQIILPGLEASISSIMTPIVGTTNTAIANLSTNLNTNITALSPKIATPNISRDNTEPSPYPTFAIWTNQNNASKAGYTVINSDMQKIADHGIRSHMNSYTNTALDAQQNWYEDFRGYSYTNGNFDSGGNTTYCGGGTNINSADGNQLYRFSLWTGYDSAIFNRWDQTGQMLYRCGTIIGAEGVRQRVSHYTTDSEFQVRPRGSTYGYIDRVDMNSATYATWAGRTNRGMSSYNDRTRTLCVIEQNTANAIRLHVWKNTGADRSLNGWSYRPGTLHNFMSEAKTAGPSGTTSSYAFYDFTWASSGSGRHEPAYHMKLVMGDNGVVGMCRYSNDGYAQQYATFTPSSAGSPGNSGTGTVNDRGVNLANTTSYGGAEGEGYYGMKSNITWDNQWIAAYSPYYYYHSGINCHIINTVDPTKIFYFRNTTSVNGNALVPFKKDKFMTINSASNGDSPGPYLYLVDIGGAATNFRRTDGTTLSYDGDLQPWNVLTYYTFDTNSNTTQYPHLSVMDRWTNP
jgi:hypothetical protein